ncbi:unnamed protein product [Gadus morhua 'NCC']
MAEKSVAELLREAAAALEEQQDAGMLAPTWFRLVPGAAGCRLVQACSGFFNLVQTGCRGCWLQAGSALFQGLLAAGWFRLVQAGSQGCWLQADSGWIQRAAGYRLVQAGSRGLLAAGWFRLDPEGCWLQAGSGWIQRAAGCRLVQAGYRGLLAAGWFRLVPGGCWLQAVSAMPGFIWGPW